jgi:flagellar hook-length control protein FliK
VLGNPTDETKKSLSSELVEQTQAAENAYVNEAKEAKRQFTTELSGHNKAKESVTDVSNTHARSDAQQFLNKVMANVSSNAEKSAIAKAVAEQLTQTQSDGKLSVHDALANAADESEIKLGKEASLSFELGHKDVLAKEVVGNAKSMVKETGQVFSIDNVSLNDKGNDAKIAVLEKELNQLSVLEREALRGSLQEKLSQDTLTPAERKVVESVLKALQLSDGKTISLEAKQFLSVKAQEQEAKGSQSKASQNNDAELLNEAPKAELPKAEVAKAELPKAEVAKADTQGFVRGLNENTELADTGIKTSTNSKVTEPVESKLLSKEPAELRQTGVSDTVNSKKIDDKPEVLATANVQLANKSEEAVEHGFDKPESLIEQEQDTLTASQSSNQQQAKMTENAAVLQRIMQTVSQIAQNNSQFDNAVNMQVFQQIEQVQQQQQVVQHSQKVVMDPAMLEAINIARHDAVKELHNRVSMMLNLNNKEAEIRLDPPELGSLQIRIRTDAETAQVNFVVQNQQAKELLEQSLPKLREMLAEQGINLGESSIEHGSSGQSNTDDGSGKGLKARVDSEQIDEGSVENLRTTAKTSSSAIDYYA